MGDKIKNYPPSARTSENDSMRSWGLMRNLIGRYMHRGREKAVANTPHFTIIFTVFYFIQKNVDTRRKTLHLLLPLPPPTRPSPTHPLPKTLTHPPFDPHPPTLCKPSNPPDLIGSLPISTYISRPPVMDINLPISKKIP